MTITYKQFDQNHTVINQLKENTNVAFSTQIKLANVQVWIDKYSELLNKFAQGIEAEFKIKESFEFNDKGVFTGDNKEELLAVLGRQKSKEIELLSTEIETANIQFTQEELESLETSSDLLYKLSNLKLFTL